MLKCNQSVIKQSRKLVKDMRLKFRLLLTTAIVTLLLVACGSEINNTLGEKQTEKTVEVQATESETASADETNEEVTKQTATEETSSTEENIENNETSEETEETTETTETEETEETEDSETAEQPSKEVKETQDNINPLNQKAIEEILEVTDLTIDEYTYRVADETEEYVEIEIYEKTEQENMPREGVYRYFPETGEILVNDYLTGEYIPYEDLKLD